jgi:hypothetical protein
VSQRVITVRDAVKDRAKGKCEICGITLQQVSYHLGSMHHRFKKEYGGVDSLENLLYLCIYCHRWVHEDEYSSFVDYGYISDYPETTPCLLQNQWIMLGEEYMWINKKDALILLDGMKILAEYRREQARLTADRQREKMRELMKRKGPKPKSKDRYRNVIILSTLSDKSKLYI